MQTAYKYIRRVWPFVGPILSLFALGRIFDVQVGQVFGWLALVLPFVTGAKIGWFIFALLSGFFAYVEIRHRHVPLTAIDTIVDIILETPSGDLATVTRTQKLRANHENVTGYHRMFNTTGTIPKETVEFNIGHCQPYKQKMEFDGTPSRWEVIHRFDPIPRNLLVFGLNTVERTESAKIHNGFTSENESYEITIPAMYRHEKIVMTVYFHPDAGCSVGECECLWISDNGVVEMPLKHVPQKVAGGGHGVQVKVRRPRGGDRYRIKWKNKNAKKAAN